MQELTWTGMFVRQNSDAWFFVFMPTFQIKIIHLFIARIYVVPFQGFYSGALPI